MRHRSTKRKVAGSIPERVTGIFHSLSHSGRTMVRRADKLTVFMCELSRNLDASTSRNRMDLSRPVQGIALPFKWLEYCAFLVNGISFVNTGEILKKLSVIYVFMFGESLEKNVSKIICIVTVIIGESSAPFA
jgi:hypothetical protein